MEVRSKKRRKAKALKISGSILFVIEFMLLIIILGWLALNLRTVNQFNYYDHLIESGKAFDYDDKVVYSKNGKVYAYEIYTDNSDKISGSTQDYVLDSYDSNYFYFKNDVEEIKLEYMSWLIDFILKCEATTNSGLSESVELSSPADDVLSVCPQTEYYFYDGGDTVKLDVINNIVDVYEAKSHNVKNITFEYYGSFRGAGIDTIKVSDSEKVNTTFNVNSFKIINSLNNYYNSKDIIPGFSLLSTILGFVLYMVIIVVVLLVLAVYIGVCLFYFTITKRSFNYVSANEKLRVTGIILFIFGSGALSYFGAKLDQEEVRRIEAERINKEQEEIRIAELNKKNNIKVIRKPSEMPKGALGVGIIGAVSFSAGVYFLFGPLISDRYFFGIYYIFNISQPISYMFWGTILIVVCAKLLQNHIAERMNYLTAKQIADGGLDQNICKNCGAKLGNDSLFCYACGTKVERIVLEEDIKICKHCGGMVGKDAVFCRSCGKKLEEETEEIESTGEESLES